MTLLVAPCSTAAARYATSTWHYSHSMPLGRTVRYGVWWDDSFRGAVIFARGASPALGNQLGLVQGQVVELCRVALTDHPEFSVTQVVAATLRELARSNPRLRAVVSFADPAQGHVGRIYQAGNWLYLGRSGATDEVLFEGRWIHPRMLRKTGWGTTPNVARLSKDAQRALPRRRRPGKLRYVFPLDKQTRRRASKLARPYPAELAAAQ